MKPSDSDVRLQEMNRHPHCCNCGQINPEIGDYTDAGDVGFTLCCNEAVCNREYRYQFSGGSHAVEACCWAVAEVKFKQAGVDVSKLPEIRRARLD